MYIDLGLSIIALSKRIEGGILIFFASYSLLNECFEVWDSCDRNIIQKLENDKTIF